MFEFFVFTVRNRMRRQTRFIEARNTLTGTIILIISMKLVILYIIVGKTKEMIISPLGRSPGD